MPTSVNDSGTWRSIKNIYRNDSGTWRLIDSLYINDSGSWRKVHEKLKATLSTGTVYGDDEFGQPALTSEVTASGAGGWPTYSYSWSLVGGEYPTAPYIQNPNSATTRFALEAVEAGGYYADFKCTVTDSIGQTVDTSDVRATWDFFFNEYYP